MVKMRVATNVLGNKLLVRQTFFGLMQSMADGVRRDGHARQIGDFITVYPVFKGPVDPDRGFDPAVNKVMIRARLLNEMELDITDWTFVDVTPGKRAFTLTRITSGEGGEDGLIVIGENVEINGKEVPNKNAGEAIRVHWALEDGSKSGDVEAAKIASNISRIDLAEGSLEGLGVGDTVKVVLRTDPAKTEFVQEEIVREVIVTQE